MRNVLFTLTFTLISCSLAFSQTFTNEFGKYTIDELKMKRYDKDTSAEAVVIYDIGRSFFENTDDGLLLHFERKLKLKILTKAGLKYAQIEIPYYEEDRKAEDIYEITGNTYNLENYRVHTSPLVDKNTFTEKSKGNWKIKKFAMPDVKEGSVIEIEYKITSPYLFNFRGWEFQSTIPVVTSQYTACMCPFYTFTYILQGANKFDKFNSYIDSGLDRHLGAISYKDMIYEFEMDNIPAFKDEGFITSSDDYIMKLDFQLSEVTRTNGAKTKIMTTWPKLIEETLDEEDFGKYLKNCKKSAVSIIDTMNNPLYSVFNRAKAIDKYIKSNFNWNGEYRKFASKSVKDFLKTKTGNSADINLYLAGVLNAAGIQAYPVLISTRKHGKIKLDYPFHHFFNYVTVLAIIDEKPVLLDATEPFCNFGELPTRCINDKGLVVNKEKTDWINFSGAKLSTINNFIDLKPDLQSDEISGNFSVRINGYDAINYREKAVDGQENLKKLITNNQLTSCDSLNYKNLSEIEKPFIVNFKAKTTVEKIENKILISPFCGMAITSNPFKLSSRSYPIDMIYKQGKHYFTTLHIPDGYKLFSMPQDLSIKNELITLTYKTQQLNNQTLRIDAYYELNDQYDSEDYSKLKSYYNSIIDKFNDKVILIKEI